MEEKYYLVKLLTNTAGQDGSGIDVYDSLEGVQVAYHRILAAYHNAEDVLYAAVLILDENGNPEIKEIVDHRPEPEPPEPEPQPEPEEPEV